MTLNEFIKYLELELKSAEYLHAHYLHLKLSDTGYERAYTQWAERDDVLTSVLRVAKTITTEQPAPICQNCGTPAQVGWHEVRDGVDSVVCHTDADGSQEIEY